MVLGFVSALDTASATLREALPQMERLADMLVLARSGRISRRARLAATSTRYTARDVG